MVLCTNKLLRVVLSFTPKPALEHSLLPQQNCIWTWLTTQSVLNPFSPQEWWSSLLLKVVGLICQWKLRALQFILWLIVSLIFNVTGAFIFCIEAHVTSPWDLEHAPFFFGQGFVNLGHDSCRTCLSIIKGMVHVSQTGTSGYPECPVSSWSTHLRKTGFSSSSSGRSQKFWSFLNWKDHLCSVVEKK